MEPTADMMHSVPSSNEQVIPDQRLDRRIRLVSQILGNCVSTSQFPGKELNSVHVTDLLARTMI